MPLDPSFVGRTYPPTGPYQVGREKIREFASAIGATDPEYHDPAAAQALGHPDVIAPPTFPVMVVTTLNGGRAIPDPEELGIDYTRVVHGDQRFAYDRPVRAGDELVCVNSVDEVTSRGGHDFITILTTLKTVDGEPVATAWCKLVVRGEG